MNVSGELFKARTGVDLLHVAYKGSPPALTALMAGDVGAVFDLVATAKPFIEDGRLKALAVTTAKRSSAMPKVPTMQEQGLGDFDFAARYALVVPRSTPPVLVTQLNLALNVALQDPVLAKQLEALSLDPMPGPAEAVMTYATEEVARIAPIVKSSGIKVD
jgi:tripartite-type tricarboxylate transporter receptor subunit TctC